MTRSRMILLVDDHQRDIELTQRAFGKSNIVDEIVVAKDGQAARHLGLYWLVLNQTPPEAVSGGDTH